MQSYTVDENGKVTGNIPANLLAFVKQNNMKLIALVTNIGFDQKRMHMFLQNKIAINAAIASLLKACQDNQLYGIQFDFEGILLKDKDSLTAFYRQAIDVLHANHYHASIAIVPQTEGLNQTAFLKRRYENWSGAYDLAALGKLADSLTIMSYDQHASGTTPGPTASIHWVESTIKYVLKFIPADKVALGVPTYSLYWSTAKRSQSPDAKISVTLQQISYQRALEILQKYHNKLLWDDNNKTSYAIIERNWLYEYFFVEDVNAFNAKIALANKYHLQGVSVFNLGNEDPRIWNMIPART